MLTGGPVVIERVLVKRLGELLSRPESPSRFGLSLGRRQSPAEAATSRGSTFPARLPYMSGVDGLRAIAVIAVLLYHADMRWIPGGFLGVEVFFVISGYLITSLLLADWQQWARVSFRDFWIRRGRRLIPALAVMVVGTLAFAVVFLPKEVAWLRGDAAAASGYVTNWYLIIEHKSYFQSVGRPSLLRHLWSLAVEGQFYVIWPLVFAGLMRVLRRRYVFLTILGAAVASSVLMALLYRPDVDPSRIYYGTDTRASGLLIGAALAFLWSSKRVQRAVSRISTVLVDLAGVLALVVLFVLFARLDEFQAFLYQGGFAAVALTTAVLIAVSVHPPGRLGPRLLGRQPLRWIGLRSYSIYLWHWPVFMTTRPQLDLPLDGLPLLALRFALTGVLAELSYRYVETPFRKGALGRAWRALWEAHGARRGWLGLRWAGAGATVIVLGVSMACAQAPALPSYLNGDLAHTRSSTSTMAWAPGTGAIGAAPGADGEHQTAGGPADPTPTIGAGQSGPLTSKPQLSPLDGDGVSSEPQPALPAPVAAPPSTRVTAIGDSVMLGAVGELERALGQVDVDAAVSRQVSGAIEVLRADLAAGQLAPVVVLHVGSNGTFSVKQFDEVMKLLSDARRVVFVNVKVPRAWESADNTVIAEGVKRYPNAHLVDWHGAASRRADYFWDDGIHLRPEGARAYADLIAAAVKGS